MKAVFKKIVVKILTLEAQLVLRKYQPKIVAITGSVGKTSTKDAVFAMLTGTSSHVRRSEKSFNSEIGVPLTILGLPNAWNSPLGWMRNIIDGLFVLAFNAPYPEWLVLEVGADRPGDIKSLASWLSVDVAVITRLPEVPVHVEFFDSPDAVVDEKGAIVRAIKKGGTFVVHGDDQRAMRFVEHAHERGANVVTFGHSPIADVKATNFSFVFETGQEEWPFGMECSITSRGETIPVRCIGAIGAHVLFSSLAAAAVATALDINLADVAKGLASFVPPNGRMHLIRGVKNSIIIDDTYNSSPAAAEAALQTLAALAGHVHTQHKGKTIAVLGDMLELGRHSVDEHRKIGALVAKSADVLATVGFRARDIAAGALDAGMPDSAIFQYEDALAAGSDIQNMIAEGDCVLVKGSQSIRLEKVVEEIMAEPEKATELLVRQDAEWKKR